MPTPRSASSFPHIEKKVPPTYCPYCRLKFKAGDKAVQVFTIAGCGYDSASGCEMPAANTDYEVAHYDCKNPQADNLIIIP